MCGPSNASRVDAAWLLGWQAGSWGTRLSRVAPRVAKVAPYRGHDVGAMALVIQENADIIGRVGSRGVRDAALASCTLHLVHQQWELASLGLTTKDSCLGKSAVLNPEG